MEKVIGKNVRESNFELLRIVGMLIIVAHHYVSGSGIMLGFEKISGGGYFHSTRFWHCGECGVKQE